MAQRFHKLHCGVQHYDWGERSRDGRRPYIADLLGISHCGDTPFAELWVGAHPKLPAQVDVGTEQVSLDAFIAAHPAEILGPDLAAAGATSLPFLLKVLSCERSLSIQAHPDRVRAARLHQADPEHYPDANHKPEIAIALTDFHALSQFRCRDAIHVDLSRHEALAQLFAPILETPLTDELWLRRAYAHLFAASAEAVCTTLTALSVALAHGDPALHSAADNCFRELLRDYPGDRGTLSAYFLNQVWLMPGEAFFMAANEPHAYLSGAIIECMANSDNVVRAGLTPKFVDRTTLLEMLTYSEGGPTVFSGIRVAAVERVYPTPAPDFDVCMWEEDARVRATFESEAAVSLLLVLAGSVRLECGREVPAVEAGRGSAWLWPASLNAIQATFLESGTRVVRARPGGGITAR